MWRHGDVIIERAEAIPPGARHQQNTVLAYGESTGHSHRIETPEKAQQWLMPNGERFLKIFETTRVIHEEHHAITLEPGIYRVWKQREYTPQRIIQVRD